MTFWKFIAWLCGVRRCRCGRVRSDRWPCCLLVALFLTLFCTNTGSQSYIRLFMRSGSGGVSAVFVQPEIHPPLADLWAWYRFDTLMALANDDPVVSWPDSSGNARDMTMTGPVFKTNTDGTNDSVYFDGSGDFGSLADAPTETVYSVYIRGKFTAATGNGTFLQVGNLGGYVFTKNNGNRGVTHRAVADLTDGTATTNWETLSIIKTAVPLTKLYVDGALQVLSNDGSAVNAADAATSLGIFLGVPTFNLDGNIAEVLIYNVAHADATRDEAWAYLDAKY